MWTLKIQWSDDKRILELRVDLYFDPIFFHHLLVTRRLQFISPLTEAVREDLAFPLHLLQNHVLLLRSKGGIGQKLLESDDPIPVISPGSLGELVGMPAPFDDQFAIDEEDGKACGDPEPKVIILTDRKSFIEEANL